jgi:IclR family mhp operon transcriptional activator
LADTQDKAVIENKRSKDHRSYANLAQAERVLDVLEAANRLPAITVQNISQDCGIPPSSVVRILETLCDKGFLKRVSRRDGYALTSKVRQLSAGFHGGPLVVEALKPFADKLTRDFLWPLSVATLDLDAMMVQYSSIPISPMAHTRSTLHKRLSLLTRAHGLAYLAACGSAERHRLVRLAVSAQLPEDKVVRNAREWRRLIKQGRARGYAIRVSEADPFTSTIAVPLVAEPGRVLATLGMTFFLRVVHRPQIDIYVDALKSAAANATERLRAYGRDGTSGA